MKDELKACECGNMHPWGIVGRSKDHVILYGPRPIPSCYNFRAAPDKLPAFVQDLRELWAQTGDLDPQTEVATRAVIARIRTLPSATEQWQESVGLLVSQMSRMVGSVTRDESKFAHLVAHTDEIVEAMRGVTQLSERLARQQQLLGEIIDSIAELKEDRRLQYSAEADALSHFGLTWEYRMPQASGHPQDAVLVESEPLAEFDATGLYDDGGLRARDEDED